MTAFETESGLGEVGCLLEGDMRRQWRNGRVCDRLEHHRPIGREGGVPGRADRVGIVDPDALEPDQLCIARVREVRNVLGGGIAGVALHHPLLPRHLVEVVVVEDEHDQPWVGPALPVLADRDQLGKAVHLHRPVADERDRDSVGIRKLGGDGVRDPRSHRGQVARQRRLQAHLDHRDAHAYIETHMRTNRAPVQTPRVRSGRSASVLSGSQRMLVYSPNQSRIAKVACSGFAASHSTRAVTRTSARGSERWSPSR